MAGISTTQIYSLVPLLLLFASSSNAKDNLIGGKPDAWQIPNSDMNSLNHWAEKSRFRVGDFLVWKQDGAKDSVLQVTRRDYVTCNTSSPIGEYASSNARVELDRSGPYYFISGAEGNCWKGQKVIVVVMSEKHRRFGVSPAPSPAEFVGPAVAPAPTSGAAGVLSGGFMVSVLAALLVLIRGR